MWVILVAAFCVALGAAGLVMGVFRLVLGRKAPKWVGPAAGGAAMFTFMLWNEYTWFERSEAALPDTVRIAETYQHASALQPWTLAVPRVYRYAAVDLTTARTNPALPEHVLAEIMLVTRFQPTLRIPQVFDCALRRRGVVDDLAALGGPDTLDLVDWARGDPEDTLVAAACGAAPSAQTDAQG